MNDDSPSATASLSDVFDILSHSSRRRILLELSNQNPRTEDEFEAKEFVADEHNRDSFKLELYHTHLPKLADSGFIDWDTQTGTITRGPRFDEIEPLLMLIDNHQDELPVDWP